MYLLVYIGYRSYIFLSLLYVRLQIEVNRGVWAINEAITNAEDKLENNKAVKMISSRDISVWISTNREQRPLTYKWARLVDDGYL